MGIIGGWDRGYGMCFDNTRYGKVCLEWVSNQNSVIILWLGLDVYVAKSTFLPLLYFFIPISFGVCFQTALLKDTNGYTTLHILDSWGFFFPSSLALPDCALR